MKVVSALCACLCFFINICACFAVPNNYSQTAHAENAVIFARAESRTCYVCTQPSEEFATFAIPYTYCVEICGEQGDWYKVKYADDFGIYRAVYGYCLKNSLKVLSEKPATVYLYKPITVTYTIDVPNTNLPVLGELSVTAAYYGAYYQGPAPYSYVLYEGSFGYISGANDDYPLNEIAEEKPSEQDEPKSSTKWVAVIIFVVVAVGAILLLFFSKKGSALDREEK